MEIFRKDEKGFTLIELLVSIAIVGVLATISINAMQSAQKKSRDAQRKSDLGQIQKALEMYYNDKGVYPNSSSGAISGFSWGAEFKVANTVYMKELPKGPFGNSEYCYASAATSYQIYAKLENMNDPACLGGQSKCADPQGTCNGSKVYNYGVSSPNVTP